MQQSLSICFFTVSLNRKMTGIDRLAIDLANEMQRRGHRVSFIANTGDYVEGVAQLDPRIGRLDVPHNYSDRSISAIRNFVLALDVDVVVPMVGNSIVALFPRALYGTGIPLLISEHSNPEHMVPAWWALGRSPGLKHQNRRAVFSAADRIHLLTEQFQQTLPAHLQERVRLIRNPATFFPDEVPVLSSRPKRLLYVGRLAPEKQLPLLIEAFSVARDQVPGWDLHIVGSGSSEAQCRAQVEEAGLTSHVIFVGETLEPAKEYLSAQVFCLPSAFEGFPLTVLEAKACGLPTVAFSECSGTREIVRTGADGILVGEPTAEAYGEALVKVMRDVPYREHLAVGALASAQEYRVEPWFDAWEALIAETAQCRGNTALDALAALDEEQLLQAELRRMVDDNIFWTYWAGGIPQAKLKQAVAERDSIVRSRSFRVLKPLRSTAEALRRARDAQAADGAAQVIRRRVSPRGVLAARVLPPAERPPVVFVDVRGLQDARLLFGEEYPEQCFFVHGQQLTWQQEIILANAQVIVSTCGNVYQNLNPSARRIEIWHASGAVKTFGDRSYRMAAAPYLICCPSEGLRPTYAAAFGADLDRTIASGVPQTDVLFDEAELDRRRADFFSRNPGLVGKKLYTYVPTFRGVWSNVTFFTPRLDPVALATGLHDDEAFLVKLHPILGRNEWLTSATAAGPSVLDLSTEDPITLLAVADTVVVDYSSLVFDATLLGKRVLAYVEDLDTYAASRGLSMDYRRDLPYPILEMPDAELLLSHLREPEEIPGARVAEFRRHYLDACEGQATERVRAAIAQFLSVESSDA